MASTARLDELKKKFDENPRRYFAPLANEHRKSGDLDQAIALCRSHLPQQPAHISGHIVLAQALFEAGSLDEAREIFHTALGLDPENLIALRYLGDIARDANDVETARGWYQRVLEVDPRNDEIVQIVRELDTPRAEPVVEEPVASASTADAPAAPVAAAPPAPAAPALDDARFAPIPIESLELDDVLDAPPSITSQDIPDDPAPVAEAPIDVHADWNVAAPSMDPPSLDTPGVDPFDLDGAGGADSLFEMESAAPADDFFLSELSGSSHSPGFDVAEPNAVTEAGTPSEPEPEQAAAAPATEAEVDAAAFEEGSFYVEAAPAAPAESALPEMELAETAMSELPAEAMQIAELPTVEMPVAEMPVAEMSAATIDEQVTDTIDVSSLDASAFDLPEAPHSETVSEVSESAVEESPAVMEPAETPTAEWQAPQAAPDETPSSSHGDLGLEVMEFVPPSSESQVASIVDAPDTDPLVGRTPELESATQGSTPASFVTETMAELYLQQGFRHEALAVYRELLSRNPADASLRERIDQIESGSISSLGLANVSETVIESALKRQSARPAKSVRSFFAQLAGRRAPAPSATQSSEDENVAQVEEFVAPEAAVQADPEPQRIAPMMSAAETLASFDPFADTQEAVTEASFDEPTDSVFGMDGMSGMSAAPNAEPMTVEPMISEAPEPEPVNPIPPSEPQAKGSLEALFPATPVAPRSEAAAQTLATAFGRTEPQGRPTRAANSELSLDKVFRGGPEGAPPSDGGFSFDQFFSDARPMGGSDVAAPAISPPETGRSAGGAGDAHDIEQFTAWLEGLKKK